MVGPGTVFLVDCQSLGLCVAADWQEVLNQYPVLHRRGPEGPQCEIMEWKSAVFVVEKVLGGW